MSEIVEGLGQPERDRIETLRRVGRFFWLDLSLTDSTRDDLASFLSVPEDALQTLLDFGSRTRPSHRFHADGQHVVFAITCYHESRERSAERHLTLRPVDVAVLVCGDYLLTVHRETVSLRGFVPPYSTEGRSEQYAVYAVLDGLVSTAFDALNEVEEILEEMEGAATDMRGARVRMSTVRAINAQLSDIRRRVAPQRGTFERVSEEISGVKGLTSDSEEYFERIYQQMNRLVAAVDTTGNAVAQLVDLRLNETMYWLTVVATIFLPLTWITGFFGMNFGWMVDHVDSALAFFALGIGSSILAVAITMWAVRRRGTPVEPDEEARVGPGL
jgi:magnesium transporter